jgi:hypothetical protein
MSNLKSTATDVRVEIDHEPSGNTIRPSIVGELQIDRQLNGRPTVQFNVPRDEKWLNSDFTRATARVWKDGQRLPVEEVSNITLSERTITISLIGGIELRQAVKQSYDNTASDVALTNLVESNTSYTTNVDKITGVEDTITVQDVTTNAEFTDSIVDIPADKPFEIRNGNLELLQSNFVFEGESSIISTERGDDSYSDGLGTGIVNQFSDTGDQATYSFTPEYDIPASAVSFQTRTDVIDGNNDGISKTPEIEIRLAGNTIFGPEQLNTSNLGIEWRTFGGTQYSGSDLSAGTTYTLEIEVTDGFTGNTDDELIFDVLSVYDNRFSYFFDNTVDEAQGHLDGPELYPDVSSIETIEEATAFNVVGGSLTGTFNDTSNSQAIELSNDGGGTYPISGSNTSSVSGSFTDVGGTIRARFTLSRFGTRDGTTPQKGFNGQVVQDYTLDVDVNTRPILLSKSFDNNLIDILTQIADQSDYVYELVWDDQNGTIQFDSTRPGLRTSTADPPIESFSFEKRQDNLLRKAQISGSSDSVREENFTSNHGTPVSLNNDNLIEAGETVFDADTGEEFTIREDYNMDYEAGEITTLSTGSLSDSTEYQISYRFKFFNEFVDTDLPADYDTFVETAPGLTSDRACEQVAIFLVDNASTPVNVADVTIPTDNFEFSLLDSLSLDQLPENENTLEVWNYENSPGRATLRLGSRDEVGDLFNNITSRLNQTTKQI